MRNRITLLNALLALGLVALTLWSYPQLPERVPMHFNARFEPDGWGSPTSFLMLPLIGLAVAGLMHVVARFAGRNPRLVNMPGKDRLLSLPESEQRWVMAPVGTMLEAMATLILLLFLLIMLVTLHAARGNVIPPVFTLVIFGFIGLMTILPLGLLAILPRRLDAAHRRVITGAPTPP